MKDIPGYEGLYAIEEDGRVWSYKTNKYLKAWISDKGYYVVNLFKNNIRKYKPVHRLVAETYIPNPNNYPTVDHIDRNKLNNSLTNLRWASMSVQNTNKNMENIINHALNIIPLAVEKRSKAVEQRDKNNHDIILNTFSSSLQAAIKLFNDPLKNSLINRCAQGNKASAYGYYWTFAKPTE